MKVRKYHDERIVFFVVWLLVVGILCLCDFWIVIWLLESLVYCMEIKWSFALQMSWLAFFVVITLIVFKNLEECNTWIRFLYSFYKEYLKKFRRKQHYMLGIIRDRRATKFLFLSIINCFIYLIHEESEKEDAISTTVLTYAEKKIPCSPDIISLWVAQYYNTSWQNFISWIHLEKISVQINGFELFVNEIVSQNGNCHGSLLLKCNLSHFIASSFNKLSVKLTGIYFYCDALLVTRISLKNTFSNPLDGS